MRRAVMEGVVTERIIPRGNLENIPSVYSRRWDFNGAGGVVIENCLLALVCRFVCISIEQTVAGFALTYILGCT